MTKVRAALVKAYPPHESANASANGNGIARPLLVAPDVGVGPRRGTTPATIARDAGINAHLSWARTFAEVCSGVIDAFTWHTYDYRSTEVGTTDHHPIPYPLDGVANASRLWDPAYMVRGAKWASVFC
jgi:hypothetical protein